MKKRLLPLLLVVALLVAAAVLSVSAAEDEKCPCGCNQSLSEIEWLAWDATSAAAPAAGGHYRLNESWTATKVMNYGTGANSNSFTLDLNGCVWSGAEGNHLMTIGTAKACTVTILDTSAKGTGELQASGTSNNAGVIRVSYDCKLVLVSGTIRQLKNETSATRGAVLLENGKMEMKGGKITDGYTTKTGLFAGNVLVRKSSEFIMTGGEITNGYTANPNGGGVAVVGGTFTMTDGKIYDNVATGDGNNVFIQMRTGDNIAVTATIGGTAEITNGDVLCDDENLTVSGTPVISELKISEGKTIALGELTDGADICVNATGTDAFTAENENASDYVGYFKTNVPGHKVVAENNVLKLAEVPNAKCPCCGEYRETITWMPWNLANAQNTAANTDLAKDENGIVHYQLKADITSGTFRFGNADNPISFTLDLNGYTWRSDDNYLMHIGAHSNYPINVNIFDSVGGGELQAYGTADEAGVVTVRNGSNLVLHSGTIRQLYDPSSTTMGAVYLWNGTMEMKGGKITDGYTTSASGTSAANVLLRGGSSNFNMTGGEITNGYAKTNGGGVSVIGGTFTMSNGKIYNNITLGNGGNVFVGGGAGSATFSDNACIEKGVAGDKGGNIYNNKATTTLNGVTQIIGDIYSNTDIKLSGTVQIPTGNSNGILLTSGKKLDLTGMTTDSVVHFGVNLEAGGSAEFTGANAAAYFDNNCFINVGRTTSVAKTTNEETTTLTAARAADDAAQTSYCPHCKEVVAWVEATAANTDNTNTHFFYDGEDDITFTFNGADQANKIVVFDVSGKTIRANSNNAIFKLLKANQKLSILDSVGNGEIQGWGRASSSSNIRGGVITSYTNSNAVEVNIYSGTLVHNVAAAGNTTNAGGVIGLVKGEFNMYGGIIKDGKSAGNGGNIWTNGVVAINISGGLITNGTSGGSGDGSNIFVHASATLNITGGMIDGGNGPRHGSICVRSTATTNEIKNAVIRGGNLTDTSYGLGGNICLNSTGKLTMNNVTVAAGNAAAHGGNICVAAAGTLDMDNVVVYDGTTNGNGGNISLTAAGTLNMNNVTVLNGTATGNGGNICVTAGTLNMNGVRLLDGKATGGSGGNICYESTTAFSWDNLIVDGGIAGANFGGNIHYKNTESAEIKNSKILNGSSANNGGNINANGITTLINCEIKNGRANVTLNEETGEYETATTRKRDRADNIMAHKEILLDSVKISGDSGLGEMGAGVAASGKVTLKGETVIGNPNRPLSANLFMKNDSQLVVDSSFAGKVTISAYYLLDGAADRKAPYGVILNDATYNGEFEGKLYMDNHVTSSGLEWKMGMPEIYPIEDGKLRIAGAVIRNDETITCYENVAAALEKYDHSKGDLLQIGVGEDVLNLAAGNYFIDVHGNSADVNAIGDVVIAGIDRYNYNADEDTFNEAGMLSVNSGNVTFEKAAAYEGAQYVAIKSGDVCDFHYISMDITKVTLRTRNAGIYYTGTWKCDEVLEKHIQDNLKFGVALNASKMPDAEFAKDSTSLYTAYAGAEFKSRIEFKGAILADILKVDNENNATYCVMPVCATPYLYLGKNAQNEDQFIVGGEGENVSMSLMDVMKKLDQSITNGGGYTTAEGKNVVDLMNAFYAKYKNGLDAAMEADGGNKFVNFFTESA